MPSPSCLRAPNLHSFGEQNQVVCVSGIINKLNTCMPPNKTHQIDVTLRPNLDCLHIQTTFCNSVTSSFVGWERFSSSVWAILYLNSHPIAPCYTSCLLVPQHGCLLVLITILLINCTRNWLMEFCHITAVSGLLSPSSCHVFIPQAMS